MANQRESRWSRVPVLLLVASVCIHCNKESANDAKVPGAFAVLTISVTGSGKVDWDGDQAGVNGIKGQCPTSCQPTLDAFSHASVTATADPGWAFSHWGPAGDCAGTYFGDARGGSVYMDTNRTCSATFVQATLTVQKSGTGAGTVTGQGIACGADCSEGYVPGTSVLLAATPDLGSTFGGWTNCPFGSQAGHCSLMMTSDTTVIAQFDSATTGTLLGTLLVGVATGAGTGTGTVTGTGINCRTECPYPLPGGTQVMLTATPDPGSYFDRWVSCGWGIGTSKNVLVPGDTTTPCTALFLTGKGPMRPQIAAGNGHTCAIKPDGTVRCWGLGTWLGNGASSGSLTPVSVSGIPSKSSGPFAPYAVAIAAGGSHTCALLSDQTVVCWGANGSGQLGNGTTTTAMTPVAASGMVSAYDIGTGTLHTCARTDDGSHFASCWGDNAYGEMGNGASGPAQLQPGQVVVDAVPNPLQLVVGVTGWRFGSCALQQGGQVTCWGTDLYGEFGIGQGPQTRLYADAEIYSLTGATHLASGGVVAGTTCALLADGTSACWGIGTSGQLGNGATGSSNVPVTVTGLATATGIALGADHACAVLSGGTVDCWGKGIYGQIGNGAAANTSLILPVTGISTATVVGSGPAANHTCAMLQDGTVWCWGYGHQGQLGDGHSGAGWIQSTPVQVTGF
jgi:alpha-tubulin suppressor-like RCC1 family protein